tara:strand:+ start:1698 stop:2012 length:315 start_codon:yes stop_codon:yes gene_type:complete
MNLPHHSIERIWNFLKDNQDDYFVIDLKYNKENSEELIEASVMVDGDILTVTRFHVRVGDAWSTTFCMERFGKIYWYKHSLVVLMLSKLKKYNTPIHSRLSVGG